MAEYDQVKAALTYIDSSDREIWVSIGNALKAEFGSTGKDLWMQWSEDAPNYNEKAATSVWKSLTKLVVPIGYVFKLAKERGYIFEKNNSRVLTAAEKAERAEKRRLQLEIEELAATRNAAIARQKSQRLWQSARKSGHSPYLARKSVVGESIRYLSDGSILIPMIHYELPREHAFAAVQTIKPDGTKLFPKGAAKSGSACRLGDISRLMIAVCEGYATGCSIRVALEMQVPVFVCFDAGNMVKVAFKLRGLYQDQHILICADNDLKTKNNPGVSAGKKALKSISDSSIIYPVFPPGNLKNSDFNDLHVNFGISALKSQFHVINTHLKQKLEALNG